MQLDNSVMIVRTKILGRSVGPVLNPPVFPLPLLFTMGRYLSPGFLDSSVADEVQGPEQLPQPGGTSEELDKSIRAAGPLQEKCCGHQPIYEGQVKHSCHSECSFHVHTSLCCCSAGELPWALPDCSQTTPVLERDTASASSASYLVLVLNLCSVEDA